MSDTIHGVYDDSDDSDDSDGSDGSGIIERVGDKHLEVC